VEAYCFEQGYSLILCNTENQPPRQQHYLRILMEKRVDGLLVLGTDIDTQFRDMLRIHKNVPQVVLDWGNECDFANVINDNARIGARLAVRHLLEQATPTSSASPAISPSRLPSNGWTGCAMPWLNRG
jgi:LacI family purine nucleotide synthesis repressor